MAEMIVLKCDCGHHDTANIAAPCTAGCGREMTIGTIQQAPPVNDEDIVMRFRNLFADLVPLVPDEAGAGLRTKKSRVVTMMLRATMQELVAHLNGNAKAISFVLTQESGKAIADRIEHAKKTVN